MEAQDQRPAAGSAAPTSSSAAAARGEGRVRGRRGVLRRPLMVAAAAAGLVLVCAGTAVAAPGGPAQPADLGAVIGNITSWLSKLLMVLAGLFLTVAGLRYIWAGGDPGEVAKAKETLKWSAVGFAVGLLAPQLAALVLDLVKV